MTCTVPHDGNDLPRRKYLLAIIQAPSRIIAIISQHKVVKYVDLRKEREREKGETGGLEQTTSGLIGR